MKKDKFIKTHVDVPCNLVFLSIYGDYDEDFFLQLPMVSVHRSKFSLRFAHICQVLRYQNLQLLKVFRTFQKKLDILFRKLLPRVGK